MIREVFFRAKFGATYAVFSAVLDSLILLIVVLVARKAALENPYLNEGNQGLCQMLLFLHSGQFKGHFIPPLNYFL